MTIQIKVAAILLSIFFLWFPFAEWIFIEDFKSAHENPSLGYFVLSQSFAFLSVLYISSKLNLLQFRVNDVSNIEFKESLIQIITFVACFLFFLAFIFLFIFQYVNSIAGLIIFSEEYRNGIYKGSGLYTAPLTIMIPFFLTVMLVTFRNLNIFFYLSILLVFTTCLFLGLRIYLLGIIFFSIIRLYASERKILATVIFLGLVFFLVSFKVLLAKDNEELGLFELFLKIAGRMSYRYLAFDSGYSYSLSEFLGFLPHLENYEYRGIGPWKEFFTLSIPHITTNMPQISLFTGMAFPFPIIVFNTFGFFGTFIIAPILLLFFVSIRRLYSTKSFISKIFFCYLVYFLLYILIEDIYITHMIPVGVFVCTTTFVFFKIFSRKNRREY